MIVPKSNTAKQAALAAYKEVQSLNVVPHGGGVEHGGERARYRHQLKPGSGFGPQSEPPS